ncbi:autoinducer binding domain-containing protein [Paracoccus sp. MBLB3053]|uniref:Autoinducer binding domain-containing protein n=1 Tax=Paracoccus aurantius TaxID=3073814 RepID=A0ABU2HS57_9RHOB|nr:autoinducer binding domain-containing protein [Paracoccus sp. MBLB3053]MDS9467890.1 autoinducer binding domain-containing protein [Paracoccus sp. MBLB3053]
MPLMTAFEQLLAARTVEEAWARYLAEIAELGFPTVFYGAQRIIQTGSESIIDDAIEMTSLPDALMTELVRGKLMRNLPMMSWMIHNHGSSSWDWMHSRRAAGEMGPNEARCLETFERYRLGSGIAISLSDLAPRLRGGVLLLGRAGTAQSTIDRRWKTSQREIELLTQLLHQRFANLPFRVPAEVLTSRQREALEMTCIGFTTHEIAERLEVTPATIEKHMRLARKALGARTTAQAVLVALTRRQIFVDRGEGRTTEAPLANGANAPAASWSYRQFPNSVGQEPMSAE